MRARISMLPLGPDLGFIFYGEIVPGDKVLFTTAHLSDKNLVRHRLKAALLDMGFDEATADQEASRA